ncbi:MAG: hypothetical protein KI790_14605 [Cyclobacteriaceae bacterium]|nr:hypothetical protein [Cyclobacteriaceae bacterium HetDA_MAG_MS6]
MATNTYKIPGRSSRKGFFAMLEKFIKIDEGISEVIHVRFLPQILFIAGLSIIYIGSRHYAEKKIRAIHHLEQQVQDLRADYTTLKADYMLASKQSEVAKKAARLGLKEHDVPPQKVVISR